MEMAKVKQRGYQHPVIICLMLFMRTGSRLLSKYLKTRIEEPLSSQPTTITKASEILLANMYTHKYATYGEMKPSKGGYFCALVRCFR